ncbi:protein NRT1/ PTR FAMILY 5.4 isoform X2 [Cucurbita moschata]|uniref:Protein NRT1/ PTR FAMILY 5.4 isoform X2 n=1 Tax=Cucurbita moschata TaxID=3662 RepID=A0A6J1GWY8_CUCMO|nr:protein NRT1/ PTR FAMILY 5.4 isoform X2 [Cucurbita moschata]
MEEEKSPAPLLHLPTKLPDHRNLSDRPSQPPAGGWKAAIFVIFVEVAEQFAFIGLSSNLIMYFTTVFHEPTATAAKMVNNWSGVSAVFPILGAFVADSLLGRFKTIIFSSLIYCLGMVLLTLSATVIGAPHRKPVFFFALYILSVGEGGHRPCVQTFAADQFDEETPEQRKRKSSFFNWWYVGLVVGSTLAVFLVIYVQDNIGWGLSFGILAGVLAAALLLFLCGVKVYRRHIPVGSPMTRIAQVVVAAARKWRVDNTRQEWRVCYEEDSHAKNEDEGQHKPMTLDRRSQFGILDKATLIDDEDKARKKRDPWRLSTVAEVEEVKMLGRLIPVWFSCLMFAVVQAQIHTFFTKQGSTMLRSIGPHFQIPPASLQGVVGLTILLTVLFYDRVFVPSARKFTGHHSGITVLQRIGIGLFISILNMVASALVEAKRVAVAAEHGLIDTPKVTVPMTIWWLIPQYMLCGVSDAFAVVGLQELFYDQMPESMRSIGSAAYISVIGIGNFLSTAIISAVQAASRHKWLVDNLNRSKLQYFYWVLAGLSGLNLCCYIWVANGYVYKRVGGKDGEDHGKNSNKGGYGDDII